MLSQIIGIIHQFRILLQLLFDLFGLRFVPRPFAFNETLAQHPALREQQAFIRDYQRTLWKTHWIIQPRDGRKSGISKTASKDTRQSDSTEWNYSLGFHRLLSVP